MSRQFKVGDIVNAKEKFAQANEMPIQKVDSYIWVNDWPYSPKAITLAKIPAIEGIKSKRGVEQYKDQFAPWKPGHLVTTGAEEIINLSDLEMYAKSIGNCAIRQMMKEQ